MRSRKLLADGYAYFFGKSSFQYIHSSDQFFLYPVDLRFTIKREDIYYTPKDAHGLPQKEYHSVGLQYNPTRMAAYALGHWNNYKIESCPSSEKEFIKAANWFLDNSDGLWRYTFDWGQETSPWISCMSQGEGISVLVRAYSLTQIKDYLEAAQRAAVPFTKSIQDGGVLSRLPKSNDLFFEEYPSGTAKHVLNGYLYSLIGIVELCRFVPEAADLCRLDEHLSSLENNISRWDMGFWSAYDLEGEGQKVRNYTTFDYHSHHLAQLFYLSETLDSDYLKQVCKRWSNYSRSLKNRLKAFSGKVKYRIKVPAQC